LIFTLYGKNYPNPLELINFQLNVKTAIANSDYYDKLWPSLGRNLNYTEINRIKFIVDSLREYLGEGNFQILDLGCGRGWMAPFLSPFGTITAIDFSEVGIEFAKTNYGDFATFILADPNSSTLGLPLDFKYDVIVSSEVIEHVPNHCEYIQLIHNLLKPGGWLILTTPNGNVWSEFSTNHIYKSQLQPIENWLTTMSLKKILTDMGFNVLRHEGRPVYDFRIGLCGKLQTERIHKIFKTLKIESTYYKLILSTSLYQMVAAKKDL
jgi:2-polyprenyl-3-methyl-5-hydroxy-6-metoxy-1,4-benzoquinol methylase